MMVEDGLFHKLNKGIFCLYVHRTENGTALEKTVEQKIISLLLRRCTSREKPRNGYNNKHATDKRHMKQRNA